MFWSICSWVGFAIIGAVSMAILLATNIWAGEKLCEIRREIGAKDHRNNKSIYELRLTQLITRLILFPGVWKDSKWSTRENYPTDNPLVPLFWTLLFIPRAVWGILKMPYVVVSWKVAIDKNPSLQAIQKLLKIEKRVAKRERKFDRMYDRIWTQIQQLADKEWSSKKSDQQKTEAKRFRKSLEWYSSKILWPMRSEIGDLYEWSNSQKKILLAQYENTALLLPQEIPEEISMCGTQAVKECQEKCAEIENRLNNLPNFQQSRKNHTERNGFECEDQEAALGKPVSLAPENNSEKETYKM